MLLVILVYVDFGLFLRVRDLGFFEHEKFFQARDKGAQTVLVIQQNPAAASLTMNENLVEITMFSLSSKPLALQ